MSNDDTPPPLLAGEGRISIQYLADLRRSLEHGLRDVGVRLTGIESRLTITEQQREVERYKIDEALKQIVDLEHQVSALEKSAASNGEIIKGLRGELAAIADAATSAANKPLHWSWQALIVSALSVLGTLFTNGGLRFLAPEPTPAHPAPTHEVLP